MRLSVDKVDTLFGLACFLMAVICITGLIAFVVVVWILPPQPQWNGERWSCPSGYTVYASEDQVVKGNKDFVHCVK